MASIKARKGNVFERLVAYNLQLAGYNVERIDDNTAGVDLVATKRKTVFYIECKHHKGFSWNQLAKIFYKTKKYALLQNVEIEPYLIFKGNNQPILVMFEDNSMDLTVKTFEDYFGLVTSSIPKGYKVWQNQKA